MATVTSYTAERMKQIEDTTIVGGSISGNNLMLTRRDNVQLNAGNVRGPQGIQGLTGATSILVCTSTTHPTGANLFTGLGIWETDNKRFYIYDGANWVYSGGLIVCTSTTRPANPFPGLEIFETDTKRFLVHNGVRFDPPWNTSWGIIAYVERLTDVGPLTTTEAAISGMSLTNAFVANRRIKCTFEGNTYATSGTDNITLVRIVEDATNVMAGNSWNTASGFSSSIHCEVIRTPAAGAHTYALKAGMTGAGATMLLGRSDSPISLLVEDIGPNGLPA